jgi:hypothetical protein
MEHCFRPAGFQGGRYLASFIQDTHSVIYSLARTHAMKFISTDEARCLHDCSSQTHVHRCLSSRTRATAKQLHDE